MSMGAIVSGVTSIGENGVTGAEVRGGLEDWVSGVRCAGMCGVRYLLVRAIRNRGGYKSGRKRIKRRANVEKYPF